MIVNSAWVHATAFIEDGVALGDGTRVWAHAHVRRGASIGAACVIGENVFVDLGVSVGDRCKIQNNALVYHGAVVEDEVFIGPAACLTNDRQPRAANPDGTLKSDADWSVAGVTLRRGASVGAHAVLVAGVTVGQWAMVGAGAVVTRDVPRQALVVGNPARPLGWVCRCGARLLDLTCPHCDIRHREAGEGVVPADL